MCHRLRATVVCLILEWAAAVERPPTASPVRKGLVVVDDNPGGGKQRCEMGGQLVGQRNPTLGEGSDGGGPIGGAEPVGLGGTVTMRPGADLRSSATANAALRRLVDITSVAWLTSQPCHSMKRSLLK